MKKTIRRRWRQGKRRIERRLEGARRLEDSGKPVMRAGGVQCDLGQRMHATAHGGLAAIHQMVLSTGLVERIDRSVELLKVHRPYHESDHVLNIAYNAICGGRRLEDLELLRNDESYLDMMGVQAIPDPTTAGDFCRRFETGDIDSLSTAINETRVEVWKRSGLARREKTARIDADGTMVQTTGECKEGMGLSYKGEWGYHPLLISLANTNEPLYIVNRSGNRPSSEGAAAYLDQAISLCRQAGFTDIFLRGDTDFMQTKHLDRWHGDGVRFIFGYDAKKNLVGRANGLSESLYRELERRAADSFSGRERRQKQPRVKEQVVRENGYRNIRLRSEDVAEFDYRPGACERDYRVVVVRKNLTVEKGYTALFDEVRYFFYITNDRDLDAEDVVREANQRCNQENLISQLKSGVNALHAPVNTLNANGAYMVMSALAWSFKAWAALLLPIHKRWKEKHEAERSNWLHMDFRTFCNAVVHIPAQIVTTGRRLVVRLLGWRPQLPALFRLLDAL